MLTVEQYRETRVRVVATIVARAFPSDQIPDRVYDVVTQELEQHDLWYLLLKLRLVAEFRLRDYVVFVQSVVPHLGRRPLSVAPGLKPAVVSLVAPEAPPAIDETRVRAVMEQLLAPTSYQRLDERPPVADARRRASNGISLAELLYDIYVQPYRQERSIDWPRLITAATEFDRQLDAELAS